MICKQCSSAIIDTAEFCPVCGMKQPVSTEPAYDPDNEKTVGPTFHRPAAPQPVAPAAPAYDPDEDKTVGPTFQRPAQPAPQPTPQPAAAPVAPRAQEGHHGYVSFGAAIGLFFKNFFNFRSRATRSEYWWAYLFTCIVNLPLLALMEVLPILVVPVYLLMCIGSLSLTFRRLHDAGKSGGYFFISLIPFVGAILLLIQMFKPSTGDNQFGAGI